MELEREKPDFSKLREICVLDDDEAEEGSESEGQISDLWIELIELIKITKNGFRGRHADFYS